MTEPILHNVYVIFRKKERKKEQNAPNVKMLKIPNTKE